MQTRQSCRSVRENQANPRIIGWLTLTVVFLILYGSFFPFQFLSVRHWHLLDAVRELRFTRPSRGDLLLIYYCTCHWIVPHEGMA